MTQQSKFKEWAIPAVGAAAVLSLGLFAAGCGSSGGGTTAATASTAAGTVNPTKGPATAGSVDVYADGVYKTTATIGASTASPYSATFSFSYTTKPAIIDIYARVTKFFDEATGSEKTSTVTLRAKSAFVNNKTVAPNVASTLVAKESDRLKAAGQSEMLAIANANATVAAKLGVDLKAAGVSSLEEINPFDLYSGGIANKQAAAATLLALSAAIAADSSGTVDSVINQMDTYAIAGRALVQGTLKTHFDTYASTAGLTQLQASIKAVATTIAKAVNPTASTAAINDAYTALTANTTVTSVLATAAATASSVNQINIYGFVLMSAKMGTTVDSYAGYMIMASGTAMSAVSVATANVAGATGHTGDAYSNLIIAAIALNSGYVIDTYVSPGSTKDIYGALNLDIYSEAAGDSRKVNVTVPVVLTIGATKQITSARVDTASKLTFYGTDSAGTAVGSATSPVWITNAAANTFSAASDGTLSIKLTDILSTIRTNAPTTASLLTTLSVPGTYGLTLILSGMDVGQNPTGTAFTSFSGNKISGSVTIK